MYLIILARKFWDDNDLASITTILHLSLSYDIVGRLAAGGFIPVRTPQGRRGRPRLPSNSTVECYLSTDKGYTSIFNLGKLSLSFHPTHRFFTWVPNGDSSSSEGRHLVRRGPNGAGEGAQELPSRRAREHRWTSTSHLWSPSHYCAVRSYTKGYEDVD